MSDVTKVKYLHLDAEKSQVLSQEVENLAAKELRQGILDWYSPHIVKV